MDDLVSSFGMWKAEKMALSSKNSQCQQVGPELIAAN